MGTSSEILIKKIEYSCNQIECLYRDAPILTLLETISANGWSVKDTIGHIAARVWRFTFLLDAAYESNDLLLEAPDVEALNASSYAERRDWHWLTIKNDFRQAHAALLGVIRKMPPERLSDPVVREAIARETWGHHGEHLPDLERWHHSHANDPMPATISPARARFTIGRGVQ